ncbi:MAG: IclR family transcriptional regulator, partial [Verrucomicrobiae bacterium]|nr:IclR family transcriptional regulator [Verrucomicrobiae bacterium]
GTHALQVCGQVGMRVPLYSCAPGKAILAHWGEARLKEWFRGRSLKRFTETTLSRRKDLEAELDGILARGFATDRAEGIEGIHCVAAPVFDEYRQPLAAVTVMAPIARFPEDRFEELGVLCRAAAGEIENRLNR